MSANNWGVGGKLSFKSRNTVLQQLLVLAEEACGCKEYAKAADTYSQCLQLCSEVEEKYVLYSFRSRVYLEIGSFEQSLEDANTALEGNCDLVLAYVCKAESLIALERLVDALVVYSCALDNHQKRMDARGTGDVAASENFLEDEDFCLLLRKLITCCCDELSPIKDSFAAVYTNLESIGLSSKPSVLLAEIGQELLTLGYHSASCSILENALSCGTKSLKVQSCILSALTSAHWTIGNRDRAISLMKEDLQVAEQMGDFSGQVRCLSNLRCGYLYRKQYQEALESEKENFKVNYRWYQSTHSDDAHEGMALSLAQQGGVYRALNELYSALTSFKESVNVFQQTGNRLAQAQQLGNAGLIFELMGQYEDAIKCHEEHLEIATQLVNNLEVATACYNLGTANCQLGRYSEAIKYFNEAKQAGSQLKDSSGGRVGDKVSLFPIQAKAAVQAKAYYGLGTVFRLLGEYEKSLQHHQKQQAMAETCSDVTLKVQALMNLGVVYYSKGDFAVASDMFSQSLVCSTEANVKQLQGTICGYIANCCVELRNYEGAIKYFTMENELSGERGDSLAQCTAIGNLGLAYQCSKEYTNAETSLLKHVSMANALANENASASGVSSAASDSCPPASTLVLNAHLTLGKFYASTEQFSKALPYFKQVLGVVQDESTSEPHIAATVLFTLGYIYFRLEDFKTSIRYYLDSLNITKQLQNQPGLDKIFYNLGLLHQILGKFSVAGQCYDNFYKICLNKDDHRGAFRALGAIGDVCVLNKELESAKTFYEQQLQLSLDFKEIVLQIEAYCSLGFVNLKMLVFDIALSNFTKMSSLCKEMGDVCGECQSTLYLGRVHMKLNNFHVATQYFNEALKLAQVLKDKSLVLDVFNAKADCQMGDKDYRISVETYERVLQMLDEGVGFRSQREIGTCSNLNIQVASSASRRISVLQNIAKCQEKMGDLTVISEAYETLVEFCIAQQRWTDAANALQDLADVLVLKNEEEKALSVFESLVSLCEDYNVLNFTDSSKSSISTMKFLVDKNLYYSTLYNYARFLMDLLRFDEAIPVLEKGRDLTGDEFLKENECALALGICYEKLGTDHQLALGYYQMATRMAASAQNKEKLALTQLYYGDFLFHADMSKTESLALLEECLELSCEIDDSEVKQSAISKLAIVNFNMKNYQAALMYFDQALSYLIDQESKSGLSADQWLDKLSCTVDKASCLLFLNETDKCALIVEHSIEKQLFDRLTNENRKQIMELFVKTCEIKIGLTVGKDYKKSILFSNLIKHIRLDMETSSSEIDISVNETDPILSLTRIDSILDKSYKYLDNCLQGDENYMYMVVHCAESVEYLWLFDRDTSECFSIDLEAIKELFGISTGESCTEIFSYLANQMTLDMNHANEKWGKLLLSEQIQTILLRSNSKRIVLFTDREHSIVPFKLLKLSSGRFLSEVFEIEVRHRFPIGMQGFQSHTGSQRQGNSSNETDRDGETSPDTDNFVAFFGPNSRMSEEGKIFETLSRLAGVETTTWTNSEDQDIKEKLFATLRDPNSHQVVLICAHTVFSSDNQACGFVLTQNQGPARGLDVQETDSAAFVTLEEIESVRIAGKSIVLLLSASQDLLSDLNFNCQQNFILSCALLNSGANSVTISQLPSSSNSNSVVAFYNKLCLNLLESQEMTSALSSAFRQVRLNSSTSHRPSIENQLFSPYFSNLVSNISPITIRFKHTSVLQKFGSVLLSCQASSSKADQNERWNQDNCVLTFVFKVLSKITKRLDSGNRNPLMAPLDKFYNSAQFSPELKEFLMSLKFSFEDATIRFPVLNVAGRLKFFLQLSEVLLRIPDCELHRMVGELILSANYSSLLQSVLKILNTALAAARNSENVARKVIPIEIEKYDVKENHQVCETLLALIGIKSGLFKNANGSTGLRLEVSTSELKSMKKLKSWLKLLQLGPDNCHGSGIQEEKDDEVCRSPELGDGSEISPRSPLSKDSISGAYSGQAVFKPYQKSGSVSSTGAAFVERNKNWFVEESDESESAGVVVSWSQSTSHNRRGGRDATPNEHQLLSSASASVSRSITDSIRNSFRRNNQLLLSRSSVSRKYRNAEQAYAQAGKTAKEYQDRTDGTRVHRAESLESQNDRALQYYQKLNENTLRQSVKPNLDSSNIPLIKLNYGTTSTDTRPSDRFEGDQSNKKKAINLLGTRSAFTPVIPKSQFFAPYLDANFAKRAYSTTVESQLVSSTGSLDHNSVKSAASRNRRPMISNSNFDIFADYENQNTSELPNDQNIVNSFDNEKYGGLKIGISDVPYFSSAEANTSNVEQGSTDEATIMLNESTVDNDLHSPGNSTVSGTYVNAPGKFNL